MKKKIYKINFCDYIKFIYEYKKKIFNFRFSFNNSKMDKE